MIGGLGCYEELEAQEVARRVTAKIAYDQEWRTWIKELARYAIAYIVGHKFPADIVLPGDELKRAVVDEEAEQSLKDTIKAEIEQGVKWKPVDG